MTDRYEDNRYVLWSKAVKVRDDFCCKICGAKNVSLESHHIKAWASYPEDRYDINNGITLCKVHHDFFHRIYGKGSAGIEEFELFRKTCTMMKK